MNDSSYREELFELLADLTASGLSEKKTLRLQQILEHHPDTRDIYVEAVRLSQTGFYLGQAEKRIVATPKTSDEVARSL